MEPMSSIASHVPSHQAASPEAMHQTHLVAATDTSSSAHTPAPAPRPPPSPAAAAHAAAPSTKFCPSQSTAYVAMLPFAYTNNDVAQLFAPFGKLARVTVLRDKVSRQSRGVAFVQFARADDCARAVAAMHNTQLEGFTLACSLSRDNGRAQEFIKKRTYAQTALRCFECGEHGHVSYACPRNVLGARDKPVAAKRKLRKRKRFDGAERAHYFDDHGAVNLLAPPTDADVDVSLSLLAYPLPGASILATAATGASTVGKRLGRRPRRAAAYFSDEDASDSEWDKHDMEMSCGL